MEMIVSKRTIENKKIYRIHHILEEQLVGLEAVEKLEDGNFRKVLNWNDGGELEDYMNELEEIEPVSEFESARVMKFLENFPNIGREELVEVLQESDEDIVLEYFLSTSHAFHAILKHATKGTVGESNFYQSYTVVLDREGHFKRLEPLGNQQEFELILGHLALELENEERVFFQFDQNRYAGVKRLGDEIHFLFIEAMQDEEEGEQIGADIEQVHALHHVKGSHEFSLIEERLSEDVRNAFVVEMLSEFTQIDPSEVIEQQPTK